MHLFRVWLSVMAALFCTGKVMASDTPPPLPLQKDTAIFAGGCFWCMQAEFSGIEGVSKVLSGYTGGNVAKPTYDEVSSGMTGHVEAIQITFDPAKVSYEKLLDIFWSNVDPLDPYGQFCDKGTQYLAGIYYRSEEQKKQAEASLDKISKKLGKKVETFIRESKPFYVAEDYHQQYHLKNKMRYQMYRDGCGRSGRLEELKRIMSNPQ